jgi:hypothetical protein
MPSFRWRLNDPQQWQGLYWTTHPAAWPENKLFAAQSLLIGTLLRVKEGFPCGLHQINQIEEKN